MNRITKIAALICVCIILTNCAGSQAEVNYLKLGNEESANGNYDKAIELYTKAIKVNPNYADAYHNREEAYQKKGITKPRFRIYLKLLSFSRILLIRWVISAELMGS